MSALSMTARDTIKWATVDVPGASIAGYIRNSGAGDGKWHGDSCGCTDDRCIGYHHDESDSPCDCLTVVLREYVCGCIGHIWSDDIREADYGRGLVRWRLCTRCTAADHLEAPTSCETGSDNPSTTERPFA